MSRVFANGPRNRVSISGRVIPKTQKMILHASLLNTQHDRVQIKGKVEQSWERSSILPYISVQLLMKSEPSLTLQDKIGKFFSVKFLLHDQWTRWVLVVAGIHDDIEILIWKGIEDSNEPFTVISVISRIRMIKK